MRLEEAPIKKPMFKELIVNGKGWIQWFTDFGDALKGEWSGGKRALSISSAPFPIDNYFDFQGSQVFCNINWSAGTLGGTIQILDINNKPIQFENGILHLYDGVTPIDGALVSGSTITLPSLTTSGNAILTGTLVLKR